MPDTWREARFSPTVQAIAAKHRFFHWELAFPEVFTGLWGWLRRRVGKPAMGSVKTK